MQTNLIYILLIISFLSCKNENAEKIEALEKKLDNQKIEMKENDSELNSKSSVNNTIKTDIIDSEPKTDSDQGVAKEIGKPINDYIPHGFELLNKTKGNLNLDTKDDFILVLKKSNTTENTRVLLLTNTGNNFYELRAKNDDIIYYEENLELNVVVNKGYFSFEIMYIPYAGSAIHKRIVTFKYDKNKDNWFLHKDGVEETNRITGEVETTEVKTKNDFGIIPFSSFNENY